MIRADTLDLQNPNSPSAKDHTKQPSHPAPLGIGPAGAHQAQTIRQAEQEALSEQLHGPVGSNPNQQGFYDDDHDDDYDGQNGIHEDDDGEFGDQEGDDGLEDDMMDKISSSPSIDDEDIDFEFVYALHTFVATVEGQANATKGDTMVLLDDSNSYWWLVRVVKDASIGYLPAEHIETPTERLARLNKHRNIDLSATMLGDNPEKSKNPLKKAMRRRNAKTVQFAAPTYHEPAEIDYSDEEEGFDEDSEAAEQGEQTGTTQAQDEAATDATSVVEPLKIKSASTTPAPNGIKRVESSDSMADKAEDPEKERTSDEIFDRRDENVARSRNGTVRNTDSFFKDDTAETKKISLTPRLLRGDSDSLDNEQPASKPRPSLEDRLQPDDKSKDEKKKKEKKSGMLSGLFKRKDKKGKAQDIEEGDFEKVSEEIQRASPQPRDSSENLAQEAKATKPEKAPQRHPSKLQKAPPVTVSPKVSPVKEEATKDSSTTSSDVPRSPTKLVPAPLTLRQVTPNDQTPAQQSVSYVKPNETRERPLSPPPQDKTTYASGDGQDRSTLASSPTEPSIHTVEAVEKDDGVTLPASQHPSTSSRIENEVPTTERRTERLSESPVEVTSIEQTEDADYNSTAQPPGLVHDTSSSERPSVSPVSPSMSSVKSDADQGREGDQSTAPTTLSPHADPHSPATTHSNAPSWSDTSLRAYMDNDDEMRDLLVIIHDKSNVVPAGPDHPVTGNLFGAEKGRLAELQSNLDNMLTSWLARKNGSRLPVI